MSPKTNATTNTKPAAAVETSAPTPWHTVALRVLYLIALVGGLGVAAAASLMSLSGGACDSASDSHLAGDDSCEGAPVWLWVVSSGLLAFSSLAAAVLIRTPAPSPARSFPLPAAGAASPSTTTAALPPV